MTQTRTATVVDGALQLDQPLDLPEQSRVHVTVSSAAAPQASSVSSEELPTLDALFEFVDRLNIRCGEKLTRDQMHERS